MSPAGETSTMDTRKLYEGLRRATPGQPMSTLHGPHRGASRGGRRRHFSRPPTSPRRTQLNGMPAAGLCEFVESTSASKAADRLAALDSRRQAEPSSAHIFRPAPLGRGTAMDADTHAARSTVGSDRDHGFRGLRLAVRDSSLPVEGGRDGVRPPRVAAAASPRFAKS
jgi:hypothetical protein